MIKHFGYFSSGGKEQQGVVRTNCLDSLDRTNAFQSIVGWKVLQMQMSEVDTAAFLLISDSSMYEKFKTLWLHNGNVLSVQYAGTESTTASLTMNGKEGLFGSINHGIASVSRFFISNFGDNRKQQCINFVLGRKDSKGKIKFSVSFN
jgi:inositol-1,4,5-trisphosphate 5-phosphatase